MMNMNTDPAERKMIDAMLEGTYEELFDGTPSYYQRQLTVWHNKAVEEVESFQRSLNLAFAMKPDHATRKDFALWSRPTIPISRHTSLPFTTRRT